MTEEEPKIFEEGEPLLEGEKQDEFNALRRKQLEGELTGEERARFRELQKEEEQARQSRY